MAEEFKLPTFNYNINTWFSHVDALWPNDYSDEKKYKSLLLALPTDAVCLLQALHTSYETAKASLLQALGKPKQSYLSELNNLQALGRHPSLLLSHIRSLTIAAGTPCPDELLRHRVLQLMPPQLERRFPAHRPCGIILDYEVLSKTCQTCAAMQTKLKSNKIPQEKYNMRKVSHEQVCCLNYEGTSGSVEETAAKLLWPRSITKKIRNIQLVLEDDPGHGQPPAEDNIQMAANDDDDQVEPPPY
ncbi:hypothetical protein Pcinc_007980 [Petrolisthes cinctipes]|uniref:Uncharacterized protein n=1 Tax=Petrolisthes cinctipes TaxID=88211 RepID=A0AAE1G9X8_PETCI|nr:hypothetical protein Pcinc_007980 [Petrolisthes cinctipes]